MRMFYLRSLLFIFCTFLPFTALTEKITVIYPDVKSPYNQIFQQITTGIERDKSLEVIHLKLPAKFKNKDIEQQIKTHSIIALGKRGLTVAREIHHNKNVVVGAYPLKPSDISGITLMTEPEIIFDYLHQLAPKIKKITVVYSSFSEWMIESSQQKALSMGLELIPIFVDNLKSAVIAYDKIFEKNDDENAIWLPLDAISSHDQVIIPVILEKAWKHKIVVFSSKPSHAKRGALFSTLPDNILLGEQLAQFINHKMLDSTPEVQTLQSAKLAVNLRTAAHLGYQYTSFEKKSFAVTFPSSND